MAGAGGNCPSMPPPLMGAEPSGRPPLFCGKDIAVDRELVEPEVGGADLRQDSALKGKKCLESVVEGIIRTQRKCGT